MVQKVCVCVCVGGTVFMACPICHSTQKEARVVDTVGRGLTYDSQHVFKNLLNSVSVRTKTWYDNFEA